MKLRTIWSAHRQKKRKIKATNKKTAIPSAIARLLLLYCVFFHFTFACVYQRKRNKHNEGAIALLVNQRLDCEISYSGTEKIAARIFFGKFPAFLVSQTACVS